MNSNKPFLILIPARNEAAFIGDTVATVCRLTLDTDRVVVIDDGSTDATAQLAERAGAQVLRRPPTESTGSKGEALRWGLSQLPQRGAEVVIVLDADSRIDAHFLTAMRTRVDSGAQVVQAFIEPVLVGSAPVTVMAACATLAEQILDDRLRAWLGWPVRLRGTGMAFRRELFEALVPHLKTDVEDVELSLLCLARGHAIEFAPEARVYDPLPDSANSAARQRARWLRGQAQVWVHHWPLILRLMGRGPSAWSLLASLLCKPRTAIVALKIAGLLLALLWPGFFGVAILLMISLALDGLYICFGYSALYERTHHSLSPLALSSYLLMWGRSLQLALRARTGWLRARPQ